MKRIKHLISICLLCVFLLQTTVHPALAAPPPEYVQQMKDEAPIHLIGTIETDVKVRDTRRGEKVEERKATVRVQQIKRKPDSMALSAADTIDFDYTYIPPDLAFSGPARVDIIEGDQVEIWLKTGEQGNWIPAIAGNSILVLQAAGPRLNSSPPEGATYKFLAANYEFVILGMVALTLLWIIRRNSSRHTTT